LVGFIEEREGTLKKKSDRHHIRCRSRGGRNHHNMVTLPISWHRGWHSLFGNLTVAEAHTMIDIVMQPDTRWTTGQLYELMERLKDE